MELKDLGFGQWFQKTQSELQESGYRPARVTAVDRDRYLVRNEKGEAPAELSGKLMFSAESTMDLPCVGDWVFVQYHNSGTLAIIHGLFPRKSTLRRKLAGKRIEHQLIASNIDSAFIVQSCDSNFNLRRLERYLVVVNEAHIEPLILLTKSDLASTGELEERVSEIRQAGISARVLVISNKTGFGLDEVRQIFVNGNTYCLLGSSGVGKTTLLNHLMGRDAFVTTAVREKDGKGRHTTARRQLTLLDNGALIIDNPGMRELGIIGGDTGIDESFPDIRELSERCRFRDCTHTSEIGCSVQMAIDSGELSEERYRSYLKLMRESEYHERSYVEKRKKDKKFGQLIKSVMKHKKKNR